jgi:hypothetical protein
MCTIPMCRQLQLAGIMVMPTGGYGTFLWKAEISIEVLRPFHCDLVMEEDRLLHLWGQRWRGMRMSMTAI